jgi:AcrR family transcriptional regulator
VGTDREAVSPASVRDAALTLFAARGYHGTALSEIAAVLGIRTPSLYNHMRSKQELLAEIVLDTSRAVWRDHQTAVGGVDRVEDRLRAAVEVYARRHATHRREALIVNRDLASLEEPAHGEVLTLRRRHERAIRGLLVEGNERGVFAVARPPLASFAILEMCVAIARWFRDDGPLSPEATAQEHATFALRLAGHRGC